MTTQLSRRHFLKASGASTAMAVAGSSWLANLAAIGNAQAATATDYKALVCVFLYGGNDAFNTVLPIDATSWSVYSRMRGKTTTNPADVSLVLEQATLQPITNQATGVKYGLNPYMPDLASLFNSGQAAIVANVGPVLSRKVDGSFEQPPGALSHIDQQVLWQSGVSNTDATGWGGRFAEKNGLEGVDPRLLSINTGTNTPFVFGDNLRPYNLASFGNGTVRIGSGDGLNALFGGIDRSWLLQIAEGRAGKPITGNYMEQDIANMVRSSTELQAPLGASLAGITLSSDVAKPTVTAVPLPADTNPRDKQLAMIAELEMIAKMIKLQATTGNKTGRQVFFVSMGGFDLHDRQMPQHQVLLNNVDQALSYFHKLMTAEGLANKVTTFTASEFGRKLVTNGDGTDHGWGGHHFVVGGAVNGGNVYGKIPTYDEVTPGVFKDPALTPGDGYLIPTLTTDQYAATLGRWFGNFSDTQLKEMFPNIFGQLDIGFMTKVAA